MTIVPASKAEAAALSALHGRAFPDVWSASFLVSLLETPGTFAFVARDGVPETGFILARVAADEAEILTLAVAPDARRTGIGTALVAAAAAHAVRHGAKTMFLEVETANDPARGLYAKLGFVKVGERRGYYRDRPGAPARDALTFRAALPLGKRAETG